MLEPNSLKNITYATFVGMVDERNRPSGGLRTISTVLANAHLPPNSRILEIGSNTGFTSVHLGHLCDGTVLGVDVVPSSVEKATAYAVRHHVDSRVSFKIADVAALPFKDEEFDLVWLSNVTSFIKDKEKAIKECIRVLRTGGKLVFIPIYYRSPPDDLLLREVERLLDCPLRVWSKSDWIEYVCALSNELYIQFERDYRYKDQSARISGYVEHLLSKPDLVRLETSSRQTLEATAKQIYATFNQNLQLCGYTIFILLKLQSGEEPELFLSEEINQ